MTRDFCISELHSPSLKPLDHLSACLQTGLHFAVQFSCSLTERTWCFVYKLVDSFAESFEYSCFVQIRTAKPGQNMLAALEYIIDYFLTVRLGVNMEFVRTKISFDWISPE